MAENLESLILSSKRHLESLFDSITDPILIIGPGFKLERLNVAAAGAIGGDFRALLGRQCHRAFHNRPMPCADCPYARAFRDRKSGSVRMAGTYHGRSVIWDLRYFPFYDKEGRVRAVVEHYVDITEGENAKARLEASFSRIKRDLQTARTIQQALLPARVPRIPGLKIESFYRPAEEVGGDLYDFIRIDRDHWGVIIADVSGHGVPAALIGAMAKMSFFTHTAGNLSCPDVLTRVNRDLFHNLMMEYYVSAAYYIYHAPTGRLGFARAGHPAGLRVGRADGRVTELKGQGYFLGMMEDGGYTGGSVTLKAGDRVLFFTDGIVDETSEGRALFKIRDLKRLMSSTIDLPLPEVKKRIVNATAGRSRQGLDDAAFILMEARK